MEWNSLPELAVWAIVVAVALIPIYVGCGIYRILKGHWPRWFEGS